MRPCPSTLAAIAVTAVLATTCGSDAAITAGGAIETQPISTPIATTTTRAPAPTATPAPVGPRQVAVVGDSITVQAATSLREHVEGEVTIVAQTGARIIDMTTDAERLAADDPDVVVINLGTNDEACATVGGCSDGYLPTATDVAAGLRRLVAGFDRSCRVGVTIAYDLEQPPMVNPALTEMHDAGTLDGVIDWAGHWRDHEPDDENWLIDFMGHLSATGADALAALVASEIDEQCAPGR